MSRPSKIVRFLLISQLFVAIFLRKCEGSSPCGICGVDVICKDKFPICSKTQVIMLDNCGCCLVCKKVLDKGQTCSHDIEQYEVCKAGLQCVNNKCVET